MRLSKMGFSPFLSIIDLWLLMEKLHKPVREYVPTLPQIWISLWVKKSLHCRILNRQWHTGSDGGWHHCRFLKIDTDLQATVSVPGSTRQCLVEQHCRFIVSTDSDVASRVSVLGSSQQCWASLHYRFMAQADSVEKSNTVGSWLKPAVLRNPTLSIHGSSR